LGRRNGSRADKEYSKVQRLAYENKKLKREIARLRNELGRAVDLIDPDEEDVEEAQLSETKEDKKPRKVSKDRTCHKCSEGKLQFHVYTKFNGESFYYRKCDNCPNRTKGKKLTGDVVQE
jgi:hypothetical protein